MTALGLCWIGLAAPLICVSCGPETIPQEATPKLPKVLLIGVDGATWDVMDPMLARGELPNIAKLIERGSRAPLISLPPLSSPVVWTTIATGQFPRRHGILGFTYPFEKSAKVRPVSSELRREPAIWNVATEYGKRVGVVGYFVTHPPDVVNGFIASDLLDRGVSGAFYPSEGQDELRARSQQGPSRSELLARFLPWDYSPSEAQDPTNPNYKASLIVSGRVDDVIVRDEFYRRAALELVQRPVDLFVCYFRIVDHSSHATWRYFDDSEFDEPADPRNAQLLGDIIPEAYRYIDDLIGELVERCGEDTNLIIVSDHGFGPATEGYEVREGKGMVLSGNHRADGIFLAAGPDIRHGAGDELLTIMEVNPIMLALLELPISDELPGRLVKSLFRPGFFDDHPTRRVPKYDWTWTAADKALVPESIARDTLDMLSDLGYIDETLELSETGDGERLDFWEVGQPYRSHALTGELIYHVLHKDSQRARELLELSKSRDPELAVLLPERVRRLLAAIEDVLGRERGSLTDDAVLQAAGL